MVSSDRNFIRDRFRRIVFWSTRIVIICILCRTSYAQGAEFSGFLLECVVFKSAFFFGLMFDAVLVGEFYITSVVLPVTVDFQYLGYVYDC